MPHYTHQESRHPFEGIDSVLLAVYRLGRRRCDELGAWLRQFGAAQAAASQYDLGVAQGTEVGFWPVTLLAVMQQFGRDQAESGHRADIVDRSKMTRSRPWVYLNPGNCQSVNNASSNMTITTHSAKLRKEALYGVAFASAHSVAPSQGQL
jgi:hypothetical protein